MDRLIMREYLKKNISFKDGGGSVKIGVKEKLLSFLIVNNFVLKILKFSFFK